MLIRRRRIHMKLSWPLAHTSGLERLDLMRIEPAGRFLRPCCGLLPVNLLNISRLPLPTNYTSAYIAGTSSILSSSPHGCPQFNHLGHTVLVHGILGRVCMTSALPCISHNFIPRDKNTLLRPELLDIGYSKTLLLHVGQYVRVRSLVSVNRGSMLLHSDYGLVYRTSVHSRLSS